MEAHLTEQVKDSCPYSKIEVTIKTIFELSNFIRSLKSSAIYIMVNP